MKRGFCSLFLVVTLGLVGCAPRVYVIERTSILEEEAGGSWPDLEKRWIESRLSLEPKNENLKDKKSTRAQGRLLEILQPDASGVH